VGAEEKVNILLVDDQPGKLLGYEVILSELGENLIKAQSANEALEHLLKNDVAVMLIDVCMPDLDGFELAAMIREHPRFQRTAIIFVSAIHLTDPDRLRGYAAGAVDYLTKPFDPWVLRAKVAVFVELWAKTQQLQAQGEVARSKDSALRAAGVAMDEANALLRTALSTDPETGRSQVEKAMKVLGDARRRIG
jgi:DNA-binding response OmpR family regulator